MPSSHKIPVYLEIGKKRTFAGAIEWPGWCRSGRNEAEALQALVDYGPRYARAIKSAKLDFQAPSNVDIFNVVERIAGDATTDFGAPHIAPPADARNVNGAELERLEAILKAVWRAFDAAAKAAAGKELSKGPRGGGRDLGKIVEHVLSAEGAYLSQLGGKVVPGESDDPRRQLVRVRQEIVKTLESSARGEVPERGARGGKRWSPRYFVRRAAWHVLDHAWEIEERTMSQ